MIEISDHKGIVQVAVLLKLIKIQTVGKASGIVLLLVPVTIPEVFAKINSAHFPSRF